MAKKSKNDSPKKASTKKPKVHDVSSDSDSKKQNKPRSKQGKLDPKKPFSKVDHYSTEESEDSEVEQPTVSSTGRNYHSSSVSSNSARNETQINMLIGSIKNKSILAGVDFCETMARKQGRNGSKGLKGTDMKRFLTWKEIKLILSKLCLTGANFKEMEVFLTSVKIHLSGDTSYQEISSDIVAKICSILENVCFMENVDHGVMSDYFNRRVADLRNRRNYEMKYVFLIYNNIINSFCCSKKMNPDAQKIKRQKKEKKAAKKYKTYKLVHVPATSISDAREDYITDSDGQPSEEEDVVTVPKAPKKRQKAAAAAARTGKITCITYVYYMYFSSILYVFYIRCR